MKRNSETVLVGERAILVPYRKEHVLKYHEWMKDPALLEATGSEPLSLSDEYEMQKSWREDDNKCTFIVLARDLVSNECMLQLMNDSGDEIELEETFVYKTLTAMVGDVNIFLSDEDDGSEIEETEERVSKNFQQAEIDIMIAETAWQRKGIGREAVCIMMSYVARELRTIRRMFCKINQDNQSSINLFRKLEFEECDYAECFRQYEFELKREHQEELVQKIEALGGGYEVFHIPLTIEEPPKA